MPTLPREQSEPSPQEPHRARRMAESFGVDAQRYDTARPGYPDALVARIVAGSPGREVLDIGCGTGIAARQFQAAGCAVLGVEPDARMADVARARGLPVEVAAFEAWQPAGRRFDTVIAAQSWHWVDPVAGAAKAARVLRPGGRLAIFGHAYEPPAEVAEPFAAAYRRVVPDSPFNDMPARRPLDPYLAAYVKSADMIRETGGSRSPSSGGSTGGSPTHATNGSICCPRPVASRSSVRISWPRCWTRSGQPSTPWADTSRWSSPPWPSPLFVPRPLEAVRPIGGRTVSPVRSGSDADARKSSGPRGRERY